jgi:hypothetical protein
MARHLRLIFDWKSPISFSHSLCVDTAPSARRLSRHLSEKVAEMRLVAKAALGCNLAKRLAGHQKQVFSQRNSLTHNVLMRRASKAFFKDLAESIWRQLQHPDEVGNADPRMQMHGDVRSQAACLPWHHDSAPPKHAIHSRSAYMHLFQEIFAEAWQPSPCR